MGGSFRTSLLVGYCAAGLVLMAGYWPGWGIYALWVLGAFLLVTDSRR